ncbi:rod shape-determining protein MreD [Comamonas faecalis]|uniref:Rod shape-determining protein MreD n=1 Tax=Comamonas faecalis TaxID=1387849 RepID=A0ABP7RKY5_9BURK
MMKAPSEQLLLPASPAFITASLALALALAMLPLGPVVWMPDWVMLLLAFWSMHQPRRVGLGVAFVMGLAIDVHQGALLGQHALAYCLLVFGVGLAHRRLWWFSAWQQALQLLPLFIGAHALQVLIRLAGGGLWPGWWLLAAPVLQALLWPLVGWVLLAPQRRPPDQDDNRPL